MGYIEDISGNVFPYDNRIFAYDWDPMEDIVTQYFQTQTAVYDIIHVTDCTNDPKFTMSSSAVGDAFVMDNLIDYSYYVEQLIAKGSPVLIYAGEFDAQDGPKTQEYWLRRLNFSGKEAFWS